MSTTKIEWTDTTWNPITGCTPTSPGCKHCYAKRMATRLRGRFGYPRDDPFRLTLHEGRLHEPLRWRKPRRVFVCSMGDLFHWHVPDHWITAVFKTITASDHRHTYQLLTKRADRLNYLAVAGRLPFQLALRHNIWFGISVESHAYLRRLIDLSRVPAVVRFASLEPLLGPVDIKDHLRWLDWVIVGGETGPGARPMHPDWVRSIRDQCVDASVPFFFKGWGAWAPHELHRRDGLWLTAFIGPRRRRPGGSWSPRLLAYQLPNSPNQNMFRVGKKAAGRVLDGRTWDEMPRRDG